MELGGLGEEATQGNSELKERAQLWNIDDPLTNHLRGVPGILSLRVGALLNSRTTRMFDGMRGQETEQLYSFFKLNKGVLPQIWRDVMPTSGTTWASQGELQHGVARYQGLPLDAEALRVMDVHSHPMGYPESPSADDTSFFLTDMDMQVQLVVSDKGTHILVKPKNFNSSNFDQNEYDHMFREVYDMNLGNPGARDKEFTKWVTRRYGLKSYWVKKGTNLVVPYR